jgi:hypothetical protein
VSSPEQPLPPLTLSAEDWDEQILDPAAAEALAALGPSRDVIFEALVEFLERVDYEGVVVTSDTEGEGVAADAPLLLPGVRIHIGVAAAARAAIVGAVKAAALFALTDGDPVGSGISLTIDFADRILQSVSRLDPEQLTIVIAALDLTRGAGGTLPTSADLRAALPDLGDLEGQLETLAERGVVREQSGRWKVVL